MYASSFQASPLQFCGWGPFGTKNLGQPILEQFIAAIPDRNRDIFPSENHTLRSGNQIDRAAADGSVGCFMNLGSREIYVTMKPLPNGLYLMAIPLSDHQVNLQYTVSRSLPHQILDNPQIVSNEINYTHRPSRSQTAALLRLFEASRLALQLP